MATECNLQIRFPKKSKIWRPKRSWRAKTADCNPSIVLWGRNFKPYKKFLPYFIFIKLLAQEVRICSELCFSSKLIFFSYEFSTFFDLFAKNNCDVRGRTLSFFCLFFNFFQCFLIKTSKYYIIFLKSVQNDPKMVKKIQNKHLWLFSANQRRAGRLKHFHI